MAQDGYIDPNWPNLNGPHDARIIIYGFTPSFALCVLAIVLFSLALCAHLIQTIKYRTWYFLPLVFGCTMEVVGYASRSLSAKKDPYHITYFVLQYFFIVTAPVFITASIYMCPNKLIAWAQESGYAASKRRGWLRPRWILWGFVACDIVSTIMQVAGAAMTGNAESNRKDPTTANNILLAGLAFQSVGFLVFLSLFSAFIVSLSRDQAFGLRLGGIRHFICALMFASLLIFLRILFRLAETAEGVFGFLMVHEAFFGALEFAPVIAAIITLALWHPGRWIRLSNAASKHVQANESA